MQSLSLFFDFFHKHLDGLSIFPYNFFMKKKLFLVYLLYIYEALRLIFILTYQPNFSIEILPISWYISVPLLCFSFIFIYHGFTQTTLENKMLFQRLYSLGKFLSMAGSVSFIRATLKLLFSNGLFNSFYSIYHLIFLLFFLVIDGILGLLFFFKKPILNQEKTEGDDVLCK